MMAPEMNVPMLTPTCRRPPPIAAMFVGLVTKLCTSFSTSPRLSPKFASTQRTASLSMRSLTNAGMSPMNCSTWRTTGGMSSQSDPARISASPPKTITIDHARDRPWRTRNRTSGSSARATNSAIAM